MPQNEFNIGDYALQSLGSIEIQSSGPEIKVEACGPTSALMLSGTTAVSLQSGPAILDISSEAGSIGSVMLQAGETGSVKMGVGLPHIGSFLTMEPDSMSLTVGPDGIGASIKLTPESITFKVGETSFTIRPTGIKEELLACSRELTAEGHNLTAAETALSVGVTGETLESPLAKTKVDAALMMQATMTNQSSDAALSIDSAMMSVT